MIKELKGLENGRVIIVEQKTIRRIRHCLSKG
jgi:hypothetical protein